MRYNIEAVGNDAATIRRNKVLIKQLVQRQQSGKKAIMAGLPPLGTRHIGSEFRDGHYRQYYYSPARDEFFSCAAKGQKKR